MFRFSLLGPQSNASRLRQGQSHLVWAAADPGVAIAGKFLGCRVVAPLWVEECARARKLVSEEPYLVDVDRLLRLASAPALAPAEGRVVEPRQDAVAAARGALAKASDRLERACERVRRLSSGGGEAAVVAAIPLPRFREVSDLCEDLGLLSRRRSIRISDAVSSPGPTCRLASSPLLSEMAPGPAEVSAIGPDTVFALVTDEAGLLALRQAKSPWRQPRGSTEKSSAGKPRERVASAAPLESATKVGGKRGSASEGADQGRLRPKRTRSTVSPMRQLQPLRATLCFSGFDADETETLMSVLRAVNAGGAGPQLTHVCEPGAVFDLVVAADNRERM